MINSKHVIIQEIDFSCRIATVKVYGKVYDIDYDIIGTNAIITDEAIENLKVPEVDRVRITDIIEAKIETFGGFKARLADIF